MQDELTEKMHSELTVSADTEIKHRVFTALETIYHDMFSRAEAMELYNVTAKQLEKHEPEYKRLVNRPK